jgi:hypothetical protein
MIAVVLIVPLTAQMSCGFPIMTLGQAQFWFLYAYSPLLIGIAFLCGLGVTLGSGDGGASSWDSIYLGKLITDVSVVWVFLQEEALQHDHERQRPVASQGACPP